MADGEQRLRVRVADERGRAAHATGLARWLRAVAPARARGTVNVAIVDDRSVRALNRQYRHSDYATDVLSFPATIESERPRRRPVRSTGLPGGHLGDIVIARGVARRQARSAHHSELTELKVLALHGLLHLLGYDHEHDNGRMRRVEERLRRKGRLREGLIGRGRREQPARPATRRLAGKR